MGPVPGVVPGDWRVLTPAAQRTAWQAHLATAYTGYLAGDVPRETLPAHLVGLPRHRHSHPFGWPVIRTPSRRELQVLPDELVIDRLAQAIAGLTGHALARA